MTRPLKLAGEEARREPEACGDVAAWLEVVVRLCGLPEGERGQVRDELRDHIEGRVRDLMLTGRGEAEAGAEAIGELGDAAELARNLRAARRRPQRRRLMATMIGAAVLAVVGAGVAAVWQPGGRAVPVSSYAPEVSADAAALGKAKVSLREGTSWGELFKLAGEASHSPVTVHWASMRTTGNDETAIQPDHPLGVEVDSLSLPTTLELLNDRMERSGASRVEWRLVEGTLVFATRGFFDKSEMVLRTYDLSGLPGMEPGGEEAVERARELIVKTAEPEGWDVGGGTSTIASYGMKLFVKAPPRVHAAVSWVLGELRSGEGRAEGAVEVRTFRLTRVSAAEAAGLVGSLFPGEKGGVRATADAATNSVVVKGTAEALLRVEGCLAGLDRGAEAGAGGKQTRVFPLRHIDAGRAMAAVRAMMTEAGTRGKLETASTDAATNSLVVVGTAEGLEQVESRLSGIDREEGGAGAAEGGRKEGVPAAVLQNIGPGEVVRLRHAEAGELAPVVARRLVEWSREVGGERFVVTRQGAGVLVAGTPTARTRATAMLRELDEVVGRGGREALSGGELGASATMTGLRRTGVPVLSDVPVISRMFTNEEPAPLVIRAEGGLIRVTAPDGTSVETEEIRVAPSPR